MATLPGEQVIWTAAAIDFEGSISFTRYARPSRQFFLTGPLVNVSNTNRSLLNPLQQWWGGAIYTHTKEYRESNRKPSWAWHINSRKAIPVIVAVSPYLIAKRRQAFVALMFADTMEAREGKKGKWGHRPLSRRAQVLRHTLWCLMKYLNRRGLGRMIRDE